MKTLLVITGPTAVGKTELSLSMAKLLSSPVISADSRQMYRDMKIGTAAPTTDELSEAEHYFVHTLNLEDYYSAAKYEEDALCLLERLFPYHDTLLMTGGSMMYIDAVCDGIDEMPTIDSDVREMIRLKLETQGSDGLVAELKVLDPGYYAVVDMKNTKRIMHALEICYMSGRPYSSFRTGQKKERPFRIVKVGLNRTRDVLFDRINRRVDMMMDQGLMEEALSLYPFRHLNSLNTVGYKELFNVIDGTWELPFAVERIKKNTRVYAKKQLTWMKKDPLMHWIDMDSCSTSIAVDTIAKLIG